MILRTSLTTPVPPRFMPAAFLLRPEPLAAALLVLANDFWLKPQYPGHLSGKLSDVGLCFFFPLVLAAIADHALWALRLVSSFARALSRERVHPWCCAVAAGYFACIKLFDAGAAWHVAVLSTLFPSHRFHAVADATDVVCLPLSFVAYLYLKRWAQH